MAGLVVTVAPPPGAGGQEAPALDQASAGDTVGAIARLRARLARSPDDPDVVFALGTLLARTAPTAEGDFEQRLEAERLLDRAFRLRGGDPAVLVEQGLLLRKQNRRLDARRVLEAALSASSGAPGRGAVRPGLDVRAAADAHHALGRILAEELDEAEHLVVVHDGWLGTEGVRGCPPGVSVLCANYTRPAFFHEQLAALAPARDRPRRLPERIEANLRSALSLVPDHPGATRDLLALLHRLGRFREMEATAAAAAALDPRSPYPVLFLALARYEAGDLQEADAAFRQAISLLPGEERTPYQEVEALLTPAETEVYRALGRDGRSEFRRALWSRLDPLHLLPANERRLEHLARVAYAELSFGAPELGLPGSRSDRGLVHIRYGPPRRVWMLPAEASRVILWNYRPEVPSFVFRRQLGYRNARFDLGADGAGYAGRLAEEAPTTFRSRVVRTWVTLPVQIVRFRGREPTLVEVVAFTRVAPDSFQLFAGDSVEAAMFVFSADRRHAGELHRRIPPGATGNLVYTFELEPGAYDYSLEALARESRMAGRERGRLRLDPFGPGTLAVSDLVVVEEAAAPRVPHPRGWRDFSLAASRDLTFPRGDAIHLYFETYGLITGTDGSAAYELEVSVEDAERGGVLARVLRALGDAVGRTDEDTRLRFRRVVETPPGGAVPDHLSLALEEAEPGAYRIRIRVTDAATGAFAEAQREVRIANR